MADIKITKKQNVKVDGVKFKAVPYTGCVDCAFDKIGDACEVAPCPAYQREDGLSVIFMKKEQVA